MRRSFLVAAVITAAFARLAAADPCGMVPPLTVAEGGAPAIERIGAQRTYVFYRDGVETIALRPGFQGSVDDFGMLIPFPSPPAIRKIADQTFAHIEGAINPPRLLLNIQRIDDTPRLGSSGISAGLGGLSARGMTDGASFGGGGSALAYNEVRVVREEAVGMYQVAVLEAGSPAALSRWMDSSGYRYPDGMDTVTAEYVKKRWCFVAIKAKIGAGDQVTPRPGMREADPQRPAGSSFTGHVQGMAFRFHTDEPVVPMRLSVFNGPDPHNVVYYLGERPVVIDGMPDTVAVSHLSGEALLGNIVDPLELNIVGGQLGWLGQDHRQEIRDKRDPTPHVQTARDLFAADLLAARTNTLSLGHEEDEKALLNISESFNLRGPEIDALHAQVLSEQRARAVDGALDDLREMHLTVISGVFPEALLRDQDLTFRASDAAAAPLSQRSDPLRPGDIQGNAHVYTHTGRQTLSWSQPAQRALIARMSTPVITQISGPLEEALIQRVLKQHQNALRYCYQRSLKINPNLGGTVIARVMVAPDGRVTSAGLSQGLGDSSLSACLAGRFRRMRFPTLDDATLFQVQVSLSAEM